MFWEIVSIHKHTIPQVHCTVKTLCFVQEVNHSLLWYLSYLFSRCFKDDYILYRDRWGRADEDGDDALNLEEFLAFLHPEHCKSMLTMLVEEILHDLGKDDSHD